MVVRCGEIRRKANFRQDVSWVQTCFNVWRHGKFLAMGADLQQSILDFLNIYFLFYVYVLVSECVHVYHIYACCLKWSEEGFRFSGNRSYRQLWVAMWVLVTESRSCCERSAFNFQVICQALKFLVLREKTIVIFWALIGNILTSTRSL